MQKYSAPLIFIIIIPDYFWLFLIIPDYSCLLQGHTIQIIADYSGYALIIMIIQAVSNFLPKFGNAPKSSQKVPKNSKNVPKCSHLPIFGMILGRKP